MTNWVGTPGKDSIAIAGPRPYVDVRAYGATGDGVTDDTAAIQAALDAGAGGNIFAPAGTYGLSAPLVWPMTGNTRLFGVPGATRFRALSVFSGGMIRNSSAATNVNFATVEGIYFDGNSKAQYGLDLTGFLDFSSRDLYITGATSHGLVSTANNVPLRTTGTMIHLRLTSNGGYGMRLVGAGIGAIWAYFVYCDFNTSGGAFLTLVESYFYSLSADQNAGTGVEIYQSSRVGFYGGWVGNNDLAGGSSQFQLSSAGDTITVQGVNVWIDTPAATARNGIVVYAGGTRYVFQGNTITFPASSTNKIGINVIGTGAVTLGPISFQGNTFQIANGTGFQFDDNAGASTYTGITAQGNLLSGVATPVNLVPLTNAANKNAISFFGNPGYNPQAAAAVTVTASPFTYTNNDGYPEQVSVSGGTVSGITLRGTSTGLTSGMFTLYPGDSLVVTYSGLPTTNKYPM